MSVRRNILSNYLGSAWSASLGLLFVPLYVRYLGVEAYGLIGLFALIQAWVGLLDMGMTPTLNREMARFTAGAHTPQSIRDLLRSLEILCVSLALAAALAVWGASGFLSHDWLRTKTLPNEVVARAVTVMAFVVALRFAEGIYRGSLYGLQRQVWYNTTNAVLTTIRHGGAALVLAFASPTITAFFAWQAIVSVLSFAVFGVSVHRALPRGERRARFSRTALTEVAHFAAGMVGITLLTLLLTQTDSLLLSRLLPLKNFGYYTLATTLASIVGMVITPVTSALYPRLVEGVTRRAEADVVTVYHGGAQLVSTLTAPVASVLFLFAAGVVFAWTGDTDIAHGAGPILSPLAIGCFLNGLMWMPYQCQLAHAWTGFAVRMNAIAVSVLVPLTIWVVPRYGAVGAAWVWVALNTGYVFVAIHFMHRRLLPTEKWRWYLADVLAPSAGALAAALLLYPLRPAALDDRWRWAAYLVLAGGATCVGALALAGRPRRALTDALGALARRKRIATTGDATRAPS